LIFSGQVLNPPPVIAGLDPAIHPSKKMDTRVKPAYDGTKTPERSGAFLFARLHFPRLAD
jgi:hypothetical protein